MLFQPRKKAYYSTSTEPNVNENDDFNQKKPSPTSLYTTAMYRALILLVVTGAGLWYFFELEKEKAAKQKALRAKEQEEYGRPKIGGAFELVDTKGQAVTEKDWLGRYILLYFGFTHCPDVCPEELEKMGVVYAQLPEAVQAKVQLVFVTCDPWRDTPPVVEGYLRDFHPSFQGLTGTYTQVQKMAKLFRVYFSSPATPSADPDYLVDHSIFIYLLGPDNQFIDAYGKNLSASQIREKVLSQMATRSHLE